MVEDAGYAEVDELVDAKDDELEKLGLKKVEIKRLRKTLSSHSPTPSSRPTPLQEQDIYAKFKSGFLGNFASLKDFRGGLLKLLGAPPEHDALRAMWHEHCDKASGFGASDVEFTWSTRGNTATPRNEWLHVTDRLHVTDPDNAPPLRKGHDHAGR